VIMFFIFVGLCITRNAEQSTVLRFFKELSEIMMIIIMKLILFTPIGVFSLILPKVATIDMTLLAKYMGLMLGILVVGLFVHVFICLSLMFFVLTRQNPYVYLRNTLPAVLTALGTSSSAATLPVTTRCAVEKNGVDPRIADFILPLGATVNMDGTAVKYPLMVIWMATAQGMSLNAADQIILALVCVLSSVGASPIPTAGVAMWVMVLEATGVPVTGLLGLLFAIEWLVDRMETMVNITSDGICAGIMNKLVPLGKGSTEIIKDADPGDVTDGLLARKSSEMPASAAHADEPV